MVTETWTDERGQSVAISSFFKCIYSDNECKELDVEFCIHDYSPRQVLSSLGSAEAESLVMRFLTVSLVEHKIVGVSMEELRSMAKRHNDDYDEWSEIISRLLMGDYFREKWVKGVLVIFPTRKLLENQKVPRR